MLLQRFCHPFSTCYGESTRKDVVASGLELTHNLDEFVSGILGQVLRVNCPQHHQDGLLKSDFFARVACLIADFNLELTRFS
jgi:hypothetical protein